MRDRLSFNVSEKKAVFSCNIIHQRAGNIDNPIPLLSKLQRSTLLEYFGGVAFAETSYRIDPRKYLFSYRKHAKNPAELGSSRGFIF